MSEQKSVFCKDEEAMRSLGVKLVTALSKGACGGCCLLTLTGDLGAGKSVLARSMVHAAGFAGRVKSPTYTLIETYEVDEPLGSIRRIAHLDLYRLSDPDELHYLGFDDVLRGHDLVLIEWPDKAGDLLPAIDLSVSIDYILPAGRQVTLEGDCLGGLLVT